MAPGSNKFQSFGNSNKQSIRSIQDIKMYQECGPHGNEMKDLGKPKPGPNLLLTEVERDGNKEYYNKTYLPSHGLINTMATPCFQESPMNPIIVSQGLNKGAPLFRPRNLLNPSAGTS
jgi:hypothetical protein